MIIPRDKNAISPGCEPPELKTAVESFFSEVDRAFPDKLIIWARWEHDRLDRAASYLCTRLGYSAGAMFLTAYGYSILTDNGLIEPENTAGEPVSAPAEPARDFVEPALTSGIASPVRDEHGIRGEAPRDTDAETEYNKGTRGGIMTRHPEDVPARAPAEPVRNTVDSAPTSGTARLERDEQGMSAPEARQQGDKPENGAADACITAPEQTARLDRDEHESPHEAVHNPVKAAHDTVESVHTPVESTTTAEFARLDRDEPSATTPLKANEYRTGKVVRVLPYGNSGFVRDDKTGMDYYFNVRNFTHWVDDLRIGLAVSYRIEAHFVRRRNSMRDNAVDLTCLHHQGVPGLGAAK